MVSSRNIYSCLYICSERSHCSMILRPRGPHKGTDPTAGWPLGLPVLGAQWRQGPGVGAGQWVGQCVAWGQRFPAPPGRPRCAPVSSGWAGERSDAFRGCQRGLRGRPGGRTGGTALLRPPRVLEGQSAKRESAICKPWASLEGWWSQPPKLPCSTPCHPWLGCDHRSHTGQGGQDMSPEAIL